mmetsp:Transcript_15665/g.46229  ORF Transcript_15665/g.46229 Transcript_15665/m.46229 type:complete len:753 (-) Transcript_15665:166-2424(-)
MAERLSRAKTPRDEPAVQQRATRRRRRSAPGGSGFVALVDGDDDEVRLQQAASEAGSPDLLSELMLLQLPGVDDGVDSSGMGRPHLMTAAASEHGEHAAAAHGMLLPIKAEPTGDLQLPLHYHHLLQSSSRPHSGSQCDLALLGMGRPQPIGSPRGHASEDERPTHASRGTFSVAEHRLSEQGSGLDAQQRSSAPGAPTSFLPDGAKIAFALRMPEHLLGSGGAGAAHNRGAPHAVAGSNGSSSLRVRLPARARSLRHSPPQPPEDATTGAISDTEILRSKLLVCQSAGCMQPAEYGANGIRQFCVEHLPLVELKQARRRICLHEGCTKQAKTSAEGVFAYCKGHMSEHGVHARSTCKRCAIDGCERFAKKNMADGSWTYCKAHIRAITPGPLLQQQQEQPGASELARPSGGAGGAHGGAQLLQARAARFADVSRRVAAHNADPERTYTMQLGRFADWTEDEVYGTMLPDAWRRKQGYATVRDANTAAAGVGKKGGKGPGDPIGMFKPKMKRSNLPKEVDWRGSGADAGVKDQGMCGSCWSFGATAAMEGAWYVATGEKRSFSEQQILDCAYDFGNVGCDGGEAKTALNYVAAAGGIALEQDYYYHSTGDFCWEKNFTLVGKFDGFLQVEPRDEAALMEAVYTLGPLAVGIDPSPDSFLYYKEGVYTDPECDINNLDHQVILFGYGTSDDGKDFWLVKNMWSKFWGNDGYVRIARGKGDCGIATDGNVAYVTDSSRKPGAERRILESVTKWK